MGMSFRGSSAHGVEIPGPSGSVGLGFVARKENMGSTASLLVQVRKDEIRDRRPWREDGQGNGKGLIKSFSKPDVRAKAQSLNSLDQKNTEKAIYTRYLPPTHRRSDTQTQRAC